MLRSLDSALPGRAAPPDDTESGPSGHNGEDRLTRPIRHRGFPHTRGRDETWLSLMAAAGRNWSTGTVPQQYRRGRFALITGVALILAAAPLGFAATVAAARWTARPALFLAAGLLIMATAGYVGSWLGGRSRPRRRPGRTPLNRPGRHRIGLGLLAGILVLSTTAAVLLPLGDPRLQPAGPDVQYWQLSTGSRLAYTKVAASGPRQAAPVLVLHGGPGIPDMAGMRAFFGALAAAGYDVYVYDQLGAGPSTRLADPAGYGIDRDVADLEAIRRTLGASQLTLIGHSYGGALAAHYLAAHPTRVAAMVLSSPGPLDPADSSGDQATARLDLGQRLRTYAAVVAPRPLLGYALLQVNPSAAHAYFPDAEADARNDRVSTLAASGLHCATPPEPQPPVTGSGFYALQYPQAATASPRPDVRPQLAGNVTPVLVVKGACDYLSWSSAMDYRRSLPNTTLIYLPAVGHNTYQDRPDLVLAAVRAFLSGSPLPVRPHSGTAVPRDYQAR